jgi:hypothetical protein
MLKPPPPPLGKEKSFYDRRIYVHRKSALDMHHLLLTEMVKAKCVVLGYTRFTIIISPHILTSIICY